MTRNIVIIGFLHPYTRPGGSFRVLPLSCYLPEFGWNPIVITPALLEDVEVPFRVAGTGYRDVFGFWQRLFGFDEKQTLKRQVQHRLGSVSRNDLVEFLMNRVGEVANYPDPYRGWKSYALEEGRRLLREEKVHMFFSCHPVISHIVTRQLKLESGIPWVADLPDLWSRNHNYRYSPVRKYFDTRLERNTLGQADALTTVSEPWASKLKDLHKQARVESVPHGFSPDELNDPPVPLTDKFTLTYTGSLYTKGQDLTLLFESLQELLSEGKLQAEDIELRFFGPPIAWLEKNLADYGLSENVHHYGMLPRAEAVARQRDSQVLIYAKWKYGNDTGTYAGKIYEYLAARRPVIAVDGSRDVVTDLLEETQAGIDGREKETIKQSLLAMYREFKTNGRVSYHGKTSRIIKYTHREMAGQFARIFDSLLES